MRNRSLLQNSAGFTLLEVIIAMAIMVMAFSAILAVEQGSINASGRAKQMNVVVMLAKNQMVETEFKIEGKAFTEVPKEESGTFDPPYEEYRWKTVIAERVFPNLASSANKPVDPVAANKGVAQGSGTGSTQAAEMIAKATTNFLSKSLREVTVTVYWKRGKGEQNFSLSTYWVDLNNELNFNP